MKKVCSYALFRHAASGYESDRCGDSRGRFFLNFMPCLIRAHHLFFEGFELWIHHDDRIMEAPYYPAMKRMHEAGILKLIPMGTAQTLCGSMLWRLNPLFDPEVKHVVCRDVDSLPMSRDRRMVDQFMWEQGSVHAILDSESHSGPLMGGMTAFDAEKFRARFAPIRSLDGLIAFGAGLGLDYNQHGTDQQFLNGALWPHLQTEAIIHSKRDLGYLCKAQFPVIGKEHPSDYLVNHIGAPYSVEAAMKYFDEMDNSILQEIRKAEQDG
jgi:hypothetical protein